jgi:hypothetical protein
MEENTEKKRQ